MVEKSPKRNAPEPFTKDDYETMYWALVDMIQSSLPIDEARRARLRALASRLSEHVRHLELSGRKASGTRQKVDLSDRKDLIRQKLLARRPADEEGTWAIFGEGIAEEGKALLLAIHEGTFADAVEKALSEPGFITEGMGGQIDRLGLGGQ